MRRSLRTQPPDKNLDGGPLLSILREQGAFSTIAITALLAPLIIAPVTSEAWHGTQTIAMEVGAVGVLVNLLSHPWSLASVKASFVVLFVPPLICLHLFLLWAIVSADRTGAPAFAMQGILPLAAGILIADVVAVQARVIGHCLFIVDALLAAGLLVALSGITLYGSTGTPVAVGVFHDHQLFGAFAMLIIPFSLSISLAPATPVRRIMAQTTSVICLAALLAARCRSAWLGEAAALLTFGSLFVYAEVQTSQSPTLLRRRRYVLMRGVGIATAIVGFVAAFIGLSPDRAATITRAQTVAGILQDKDNSAQWRLEVWTGTKTMIAQRYLRGWGVGSYPLRHFPFTKAGHSAEVVQRQGPSIEDEAHDSYLQIAAELGVIGLGLWLGAFGTLIVFSVPMVRRLAPDRLRQLLLVGGVSAIVGQMVDALADPGWQFGCITLNLWIIFGLVVSSFLPPLVARPERPQKTVGTLPWPQRAVFIFISFGIGCWLVRLVLQTAFALPAPHL